MMGATLLDDADSLDRSSLEAARLMLTRAAAVREDVPNLQVLYARANELTNGDAASARDALARAHAAVPARDDYTMMLSHALARAGDFAAARALLGELMAHPYHPEMRDIARQQMQRLVTYEQELREASAASARARSSRLPAPTPPGAPSLGDDTSSGGDTPSRGRMHYVYRTVGEGETRIEGILERIDCLRVGRSLRRARRRSGHSVSSGEDGCRRVHQLPERPHRRRVLRRAEGVRSGLRDHPTGDAGHCRGDRVHSAPVGRKRLNRRGLIGV